MSKIRILISCLILGSISALLWFKVNINSDSLFLDDLANDIFSKGGYWSDWRFSPAPAYFPDMLLYFIAYKILPSAPWRIFFVSVLQVAILAGVASWTIKQLYTKISLGAIEMQLLLIAFVTLVAVKSNMWLYFYTTNNHYASLVFSLVCLVLLIRLYSKPTLFDAVGLILFGGIAKASTAVFLISFLVPAICLMSLVFFISANSSHVNGRRVLWILILLVASYLMALLIESILTYHKPFEGRAPGTFEAAGSALKLFLMATKDSFSRANKSVFILSNLVLFSFLLIIYTILRSIKVTKNGVLINQDRKLLFVMAFLFMVILINVLGAILSGGIVDWAAYRYFTFPISLILMLALIILDKLRWFSSKIWTGVFIAFGSILVFCMIQTLKSSVASNKNASPVADCLIEVGKKGFSLKSGISDYGNARAVSYYLPNKNLILPTLNDMTPFFWMSSLAPIRRINHSSYHYNFAILYNTNDNPFSYSPQTIGRKLPAPDSIHQCTKSAHQIWLYENDSLDNSVKNTFTQFLFRNKLDDTPNR